MNNHLVHRRNRRATRRVWPVTLLLVLVAMLWGGCTQLKFPISHEARFAPGSVGYFVGRVPGKNYRFISGSTHMGNDRQSFHFRPLCTGRAEHFDWRVFYDRSLEETVTAYFHGEAGQFWEKYLGYLQALAGDVFGNDNNALDLWVYLVPADAKYNLRADRYSPDHIPLSFYVPCPRHLHGDKNVTFNSHSTVEEAFEDQLFYFLSELAHEYAHTQVATGGISFPNNFSEEVAVETFSLAFTSEAGGKVEITGPDDQPAALPVSFPDDIPRDRDELYAYRDIMCPKNILHCLGKNSLHTDADRRALLALTRAMFKHPHDYTKSFFPVELIEPVALAAAKTEVPDRKVPVAK